MTPSAPGAMPSAAVHAARQAGRLPDRPAHLEMRAMSSDHGFSCVQGIRDEYDDTDDYTSLRTGDAHFFGIIDRDQTRRAASFSAADVADRVARAASSSADPSVSDIASSSTSPADEDASPNLGVQAGTTSSNKRAQFSAKWLGKRKTRSNYTSNVLASGTPPPGSMKYGASILPQDMVEKQTDALPRRQTSTITAEDEEDARSKFPSQAGLESSLTANEQLDELPNIDMQEFDHERPSMALTTTSSVQGQRAVDELPKTLYRLLYQHRVHFTQLKNTQKAHPHILQLIKALISVAPNAAPMLEMWPPAFRTYNVLVPNFMNLPFSLWGVAAPRSLIGLSLYYSSRGFGCMYCSLHSCVFALRRGTRGDAILGTQMNKEERAVATVAYALGTTPSRLTESDRQLLRDNFSAANVEWFVLASAMMGFLNRWMDAVGTAMELTTVREAAPVLLDQATGWHTGKHGVATPEDPLQEPDKRGKAGYQRKDSLRSNLALFKHFPHVIKYDAEVTKDVPKSWPEVGRFLSTHVGHAFPILAKLSHSRAICAIATMLRENLNASECSIDLEIKYLSAMIFAGCAKNRLLFEEFKKIAVDLSPEISADMLTCIEEYAWDESPDTCDFSRIDIDRTPLADTDDLTFAEKMILVFAKACSSSPPQTGPLIVEIADAYMTPPQVIELVTWVSVTNMLHRLYCFYFPGSFDGPRTPFEPLDLDLSM